MAVLIQRGIPLSLPPTATTTSTSSSSSAITTGLPDTPSPLPLFGFYGSPCQPVSLISSFSSVFVAMDGVDEHASAVAGPSATQDAPAIFLPPPIGMYPFSAQDSLDCPPEQLFPKPKVSSPAPKTSSPASVCIPHTTSMYASLSTRSPPLPHSQISRSHPTWMRRKRKTLTVTSSKVSPESTPLKETIISSP